MKNKLHAKVFRRTAGWKIALLFISIVNINSNIRAESRFIILQEEKIEDMSPNLNDSLMISTKTETTTEFYLHSIERHEKILIIILIAIHVIALIFLTHQLIKKIF